ncbi:hypothetical protein Phum_PHUM566000 [Pediculus humanus corporis]|uniref:Spaetzle domain-containing protein n=1 Tax=Pediculus humanus subsp. corporis TaxID=121224 RepID=E0W100_PEDHC|nr:uncharacterized protein Phum_PHUM566000 [Pediculus humanus corporis]EEB19305.1 hypothetical protein Phum_PHUM566000 [Pediculus humanus corporis]
MNNDVKGLNETKFINNDNIHHVYRRVASSMVPIRDREKTSICSYKVITDINNQRIPDKIDKVICLKDSCKCSNQGGFKCTQLYTQLNVTYVTNDFLSNFEFELIDVEYACVCSRAPGGSNVNLLEPVFV